MFEISSFNKLKKSNLIKFRLYNAWNSLLTASDKDFVVFNFQKKYSFTQNTEQLIEVHTIFVVMSMLEDKHYRAIDRFFPIHTAFLIESQNTTSTQN